METKQNRDIFEATNKGTWKAGQLQQYRLKLAHDEQGFSSYSRARIGVAQGIALFLMKLEGNRAVLITELSHRIAYV